MCWWTCALALGCSKREKWRAGRVVTTVCIKRESHLPATHQWPSLYCPDQTGNVRCVSENSICVWKKRGVWVHMCVQVYLWARQLVGLWTAIWIGLGGQVVLGRCPQWTALLLLTVPWRTGGRLSLRRKLMYFLHPAEWTKSCEVGTAVVVG